MLLTYFRSVVLCIFIFFINVLNSYASDEYISQVTSIDRENFTIVIGDSMWTYTQYLIVQEEGSDRRLPVSRLAPGVPIMDMDMEIDHSRNLRQINKIILKKGFK